MPLTNAQQAERHLKRAEHYLTKSKKAGRIEYHVQLATTANAHATLAVFYQNADPSVVIVQGDEDDEEDEEDVDDEVPAGGERLEAAEELGVALAQVPAPAGTPCCSKAIGKPGGRHYGPCAVD